MSNTLSLEKRTEVVKLSLEKAGVQRKDICLRVGLALDKSGSAEHFYHNGQFEELVDRLLPVSANMDDDGTIDTWLFHTKSMEVGPATPKNYGNFISKEVMQGKYRNNWGGTEYAPVMRDIHHFYFGTEEKKGFFGFGKAKAIPVTDSNIPALVFFVTDGMASDNSTTIELLDKIKNEPIYFMCVGVGDVNQFRFLEKIAKIYDNVGFVNFNNLNITDEEMYNTIINGELAEWVNNQKA